MQPSFPFPQKCWRLAAPGMPNVEVAGLTIVQKERRLYAASHGLGAWLLRLPAKGDDDDDDAVIAKQ